MSNARFTFDFEKFIAAVHHLVDRGIPGLDKYKICKLLFLADKYHLVRYGRPIIGDRYCPLPHGPIPSRALDLLNDFISSAHKEEKSAEIEAMSAILRLEKKYQYPRFVSKRRMTKDERGALSQSDRKALDHVIKEFGDKGFYELKSLTHAVYAYRKATEENLGEMRYEDFFEEDSDAIGGAREQMLENCQLSRAFPHSEDL